MASNKENDLKEELGALLKESFVAEAADKVWSCFENALKHLDDQSRLLLLRHFKGTSFKDISLESQIDEAQLRAWVAQKKQELIQRMKKEFTVKQ